jgi:hypothetical protein
VRTAKGGLTCLFKLWLTPFNVLHKDENLLGAKTIVLPEYIEEYIVKNMDTALCRVVRQEFMTLLHLNSIESLSLLGEQRL